MNSLGNYQESEMPSPKSTFSNNPQTSNTSIFQKTSKMQQIKCLLGNKKPRERYHKLKSKLLSMRRLGGFRTNINMHHVQKLKNELVEERPATKEMLLFGEVLDYQLSESFNSNHQKTNGHLSPA